MICAVKARGSFRSWQSQLMPGGRAFFISFWRRLLYTGARTEHFIHNCKQTTNCRHRLTAIAILPCASKENDQTKVMPGHRCGRNLSSEWPTDQWINQPQTMLLNWVANTPTATTRATRGVPELWQIDRWSAKGIICRLLDEPKKKKKIITVVLYLSHIW